MFIRQYPLTYKELEKINIETNPHNKWELIKSSKYPQICSQCNRQKKCHLFYIKLEFGSFLSFTCSIECVKNRRNSWGGNVTIEVKRLNEQEIFTLQCLIKE